MNAVNDSAATLIRAPLEATLKKQRAAYLANPEPDYTARCADLRKLERLVREHQDAICPALSAAYGNRARHETLLTEVMPVLKGIPGALKPPKRWMKPQRRGVDRLAF